MFLKIRIKQYNINFSYTSITTTHKYNNINFNTKQAIAIVKSYEKQLILKYFFSPRTTKVISKFILTLLNHKLIVQQEVHFENGNNHACIIPESLQSTLPTMDFKITLAANIT